MTVTLYLGDCLDVMRDMPTGSVDAVLADLPYGTTQCKWDTVIPLESLWAEYRRLVKPHGAVVLFGAQPFTSALVMSNADWFKYEMIWRKVRVTGHLDANRRPLREHENILVFCDGQPTYIPQMTQGQPHVRGPWGKRAFPTTVYGDFLDDSSRQNVSDLYYPRSTVEFRAEMQSEHPTQKPVGLLEYLVRTYTNEGAVVMDNVMGSGTTGVACVQTGRNFIGVEIDPTYYAIAEKRIREAQMQPALEMIAK